MSKRKLISRSASKISKLEVSAKKKEFARYKLEITAKRLATTAKEKEDIKNKLEIIARQLAITAKEKENIRGKLELTAKRLAITAKEKESVRQKLEITAKRLAKLAKEKENVRSKLAVVAETLRLKAKQLAATAKEKEDIRSRLEITAKEKENIRTKLEITAKQLAETAEEKEKTRSKLETTAKQLAETAEEKEETRSKLEVAAKQLAVTAEEKEATRSKLESTAKQLAETAKEKEDVRQKLEITAQKLAVTAKEIESANKELRSLDLAKDEFVSIASHQLRTPLTALKGYTGMLIDEDAGPINDKQREYLNEIKNANDRMIGLITALLNVSRVDLGVFVIDPEPVNFQEVAESVIKELELKIKEKKLQWKVNFEKDLPLISADLRITRMIFQNLLTNAVKYTPLNGNISFNINKDGSNILISVTDTGYGIPEAVKSKIFTKLFRADNVRVKDPTGTGLGLYIIKATIEQTGGKIWFESKENQGSTFYVSIPLTGMKKKEGTRRLE